MKSHYKRSLRATRVPRPGTVCSLPSLPRTPLVNNSQNIDKVFTNSHFLPGASLNLISTWLRKPHCCGDSKPGELYLKNSFAKYPTRLNSWCFEVDNRNCDTILKHKFGSRIKFLDELMNKLKTHTPLYDEI